MEKTRSTQKKVEVVLDRWLNLQKIIKEEITVNEIITKQQHTTIESLKNYYYDYYKIKLKIRETFENVINMDNGRQSSVQYELSENTEKMLLEVFDPIQKLLFLFRNNFQYILTLISIIDKEISSNSKEKEALNTIVDLLCHQFYENLLIQKTEQEEFLILLYCLIKKEIENMYSASVTSFLDDDSTFVGKLLKSYTKKQEIKTYLGITLGSLILKIDNSKDKCIDVNLNRLQNHVLDKKREIKNKSYSTERWKNLMGSGIDNENLTKQIRKSTIARRVSFRNANAPGEDLITFSLKEGIYVTKLNSEVVRGQNENKNIEITGQVNNTNKIETGGNIISNDNLNININIYNINCHTHSEKDLNRHSGLDLNLASTANTAAKAKSNNNINANNEYFLNIVNNNDSYRYMDSDEEFNTDYMIEITRDELRARMQNESDENMKEFYIKQLERMDNSTDIYTNKKFLIQLKKLPEGPQILLFYKENVIKIKELIDSIVKSLIDNLSTIPYTLRCICKIIKISIDKKFPEISQYEKNSFIGEFIFGKCILPILINSDINAVITSNILSLNTKRCLTIITKVLTKINRGLFFDETESEYTIFNHYIIEIIPVMNGFYDNLIDVQLPDVLDSFISQSSELNNSTEKVKLDPLNEYLQNGVKGNVQTQPQIYTKYNYFKENEEELANIQCVCFSIQDILLMLKYIKPRLNMFKNLAPVSNTITPPPMNTSSIFFIKTIEKISNQENYLNQLLKASNANNMRYFFLIFNVENNPEKMSLLYPKTFRFTFTNEIESKEMILRRIKTCIKLILKGLNLINHRVYSHLNRAFTTQNFFIALNQIMQIEETTETEFNDKIPLNWYSLYMTSNLAYLSEEYKKNDFEGLYQELLKEEGEEISFLNSKSILIIAKYGMNTRCAEKLIEKIKRDLIKVKQIEKFMRMETFIRKAEIKVCVKHNLDEDSSGNISMSKQYGGFFDSFFFWSKRKTVISEVSRINTDPDEESDYHTISVKITDKCFHKRIEYLEKLTEGKPEKKTSKGKSKEEDKENCHANNVKEFIKIIGRFKEIKEDIIKGDQRHKIYVTLSNYIDIVRDYLYKDINLFGKQKDEEVIEEILDGVENYIVKSLYDKVYPEDELEKDREFFEKTCKLFWVMPKHLEINNEYFNENVLELAISCIRKIDDEKSPYDKLKCVSTAHKIINNLIKFCSGKDEHAGADDLSPIFQYIILKAKPRRIFSNINFIKSLIHPKKLQGYWGLLLAQVESAAEFILNEIDHLKSK